MYEAQKYVDTQLKLKGTMTTLLFLLMLTWSVLPWTTGLDHVTTSSWRRLSGQDMAVSGYEVWVRGRSKVECIRECNKYSHCTSFVFNVSSRTCYLQPALDNTTNTAHLGQVYVNTGPRCFESKVPSCNGSVIWNRTLTSLMGRVTCHDDFINTTGDVIVRCLADGAWETEGNCLQRVWRNPPLSVFPVAVPLPVGPRWSVCIEGTPTSPTRFTVDLLTGSGDMALHADFRFNFSGTTNAYYLGHRLNGSYTGGHEFRPFFFTVGVPFSFMISTYATQFSISVGNIAYASYTYHAKLPPADVTAVDITNGVNVTRLDVLCYY